MFHVIINVITIRPGNHNSMLDTQTRFGMRQLITIAGYHLNDMVWAVFVINVLFRITSESYAKQVFMWPHDSRGKFNTS